MSTQYRADLPAWLLIGGFSCLSWLPVWFSASSSHIDVTALLIAFAVSGFAFAWLASFRIVLTSSEVHFRSLFRGRQSIRHEQIRRVRLAWSMQRRTRGPLRLVVEPRDSSTRELDINAKVFSRAAIDAVLDLGARVAEADDGGLRDGVVMKTVREWKERHKV